MCLYPKLIINRKYLPNIKNGGNPPHIKDERTRYVPVGCGKCMECRKQKSRQWQIRLQEEIRTNKIGKFITMTFSEDALIDLELEIHKIQKKQTRKLSVKTSKKIKIIKLSGYELDNEIAIIATRRYLERWRKKFGTSQKHWLCTELGQQSTERIHIHGIIWTNETLKTVREIWQYGTVNRLDKDWSNNYVTERTVNYIVKYINKTDIIHKEYTPIILTSPAIGKEYINRDSSKKNKYKGTETKETYTTRDGIKLPLPIYYRNKIYTDEEKEKLWLQLLDKEKRYVNGIEVDISKTEQYYEELLEQQRIINIRLGYGTDNKNEDRIKYERDKRNLQRMTRIEKQRKKGF
nr:MAG: replication initiator protein [Microviridae sp.]